MPDIFDESTKILKALVKDTEKCADKIFTACEQLGKLVDKVDKKQQEKFREQIATIIESCHFQDFTGQRTTTVISHLKHGKEKVGAIEPKTLSFEESLMQGPQLETASQEEIDKLFEKA
jgi:chemotaxis regulatin CheY-phosphate phosphatase CheZ